MMNKRKELELYVHIPFCARKCGYCDFLSFSAPNRVQRDYAEHLAKEIRAAGRDCSEYEVSSVFIGGGTPSLLQADDMEKVLIGLRESFLIRRDAEFTVEANPGTLTMEKLSVFRRYGANRISLGLQSADDKELKLLGRIHTFDEFLKSYQRVRLAGFENVNIDLMSGLPGQDIHSFRNTLKKVAMLKPEHISAYSLILEENTPFYERYADNPFALPDEEEDREIYRMTGEFLQELGYERYEISNYARPGMECRHNIGYWTGTEYLGLGLGASSQLGHYRFHNLNDLQEYLELPMEDGGYRELRRNLTFLPIEARMEEYMFLGLRLTRGVSASDFAYRFGQNMWSVYGSVIEKYRAEGLLDVRMPDIRLTEKGIDVSNYVMSGFLLD